LYGGKKNGKMSMDISMMTISMGYVCGRRGQRGVKMQKAATKKNEGKLSALMHRYRHAWVLSYFIIYLAWFAYLEQTVTTRFHIITMPVDLKIPFCEYFVIPYFLWFGYVAFGVGYFFFHSRKDFYRLCGFLFAGMTIFLIVSTVYPNGHYLRPTAFERENICMRLVEWLYATDTATNLFPSIHVYNSLGIHIAITRSRCFRRKKTARFVSLVLCISIILSTMFLKQHSVFDVMTAMALSLVMYYFIYSQAYRRAVAAARLEREQRRREWERGWRV